MLRTRPRAALRTAIMAFLLVAGILGMHGTRGALVVRAAGMAQATTRSPMTHVAPVVVGGPAHPAPTQTRHDMHQATPCLGMTTSSVVAAAPPSCGTRRDAQLLLCSDEAARQRLQRVHAPPETDLAVLCILRT